MCMLILCFDVGWFSLIMKCPRQRLIRERKDALRPHCRLSARKGALRPHCRLSARKGALRPHCYQYGPRGWSSSYRFVWSREFAPLGHWVADRSRREGRWVREEKPSLKEPALLRICRRVKYACEDMGL